MIHRSLESVVKKRIQVGKAVVLLGPRQVGKSTLLKKLLQEQDERVLFLDCDDAGIRQQFEKQTLPDLKNLLGPAKLVFIDEAQRVRDIGVSLKIITDQLPDKALVVSGSSAFELANEINEPLTGRKWEYQMYPLSTAELVAHHGQFEEGRNLEQRMIYGNYPEVINHPEDSRSVLIQLASSYLYKDIFSFQELRKPELLDKLLKAIAMQIGSESSYRKLAEIVGSDVATVQRYLDLLEKTFIIFRLTAFSRNLRTELKKSRKFYFVDCGVRNAVIGDFRPLDQRTDIGGLWENYLISERRKYNAYNGFYGRSYFWRTNRQQEVDYLEEYDNKLFTYEFKWSIKRKARLPLPFRNNYPNHEFQVVTPENYFSFLTKEE